MDEGAAGDFQGSAVFVGRGLSYEGTRRLASEAPEGLGLNRTSIDDALRPLSRQI